MKVIYMNDTLVALQSIISQDEYVDLVKSGLVRVSENEIPYLLINHEERDEHEETKD